MEKHEKEAVTREMNAPWPHLPGCACPVCQHDWNAAYLLLTSLEREDGTLLTRLNQGRVASLLNQTRGDALQFYSGKARL